MDWRLLRDVRAERENLVSRRLDDGCLVQGGVVMRKLPMIENGLEQGAQKPAVALAQQHGNATQRAGTSVGVRQGQAYDARADLSASGFVRREGWDL